MNRTRWEGDRGETLLELLIALVIMGITATSIVVGVGTAARSSGLHRKSAVASTLVREYAEKVKGVSYVDCASGTSYSASSLGLSVPSGFAATTPTVNFWNGASFAPACPPDPGVQRVRLTVRSSDNEIAETLDVIVRKP